MTTSNATMTPTGEDAPAAAMHRALKQDEMTNTQDLFEAVLTRDNLTRAWKRVKSNHGAPGIDGITVDDFAAYLRGWTAYFGISEYYRAIPELDEWIRRRMRMCYWKQWRLCRTKIRHLRNLGVSLKSAMQHAASSKNYWHMARSPALQQALSNAWLKTQGLVSVKDLWCKAQGYAG